MDMMRPVLLALPPKASVAPTFVVTGNGNNTRLTLTWVDNSITETSFLVQRQSNNTGAWTTLSTVTRSLAAAEHHGSGVDLRGHHIPVEQHPVQLPHHRPEHGRRSRAVRGHQRRRCVTDGLRHPGADQPDGNAASQSGRRRPGEPRLHGQPRHRDRLRDPAFDRWRDVHAARHGPGSRRHRSGHLRRHGRDLRHRRTPTEWRTSPHSATARTRTPPR